MKRKTIFILVLWLLTLLLMFLIARSDKEVTMMFAPSLSPEALLVLETVKNDTFLQQYISNPARRARIKQAEKKLK